MFRNGCLNGWFVVRRELPRSRRTVLAVMSFVLPLALWCVVSYVPFIWHPDVKLTLAANTERMSAVFTAGNRLSREFFPQYVEAIRIDNRETLAARAANTSIPGAKRANRLLLRQIAPVAIENGWLPRGEEQNDAALYQLWRALASGEKIATRPIANGREPRHRESQLGDPFRQFADIRIRQTPGPTAPEAHPARHSLQPGLSAGPP